MNPSSSPNYTEDYADYEIPFNHTYDDYRYFHDYSISYFEGTEYHGALMSADFSPVSVILGLVNAACFGLGLIGNIWMILTKPLCLGAHHIYVQNFGIANILSLVLLPLFIVSQFTDGWLFSMVVCKLASVLPSISWTATPLLHIIINVDFLQKLKNPQEHSGTRRPWIFCGILYFFCILPSSLPAMFTSGYDDFYSDSKEKDENLYRYYCFQTSMIAIFMMFYISSFTILYLLPMVIVCPIYHAGKRKLKRQSGDFSYNELNSNTARKLHFNLVNLVGFFLIYGLYWVVFWVLLMTQVVSSNIELRTSQHYIATTSRLYAVFLPIAYYVLKRRYNKARNQTDDTSEIEIAM